MVRSAVFFIGLVLFVQTLFATDAQIISMKGEVKVRRGVEENWAPAAIGVLLEDIDTILTGEAGEVILKIREGLTFRLGPNALLDIADLRTITEQELFLFLMRQKVGEIDKRREKTQLRIGNVSVVHGASKDTLSRVAVAADAGLWKQEKNGAIALFEQEYYPNTIIKLHKILTYYPEVVDCGELHCYLGYSFEKLNNSGQAIDAYRMAVSRSQEAGCNTATWSEEARAGLERLKE